MSERVPTNSPHDGSPYVLGVIAVKVLSGGLAVFDPVVHEVHVFNFWMKDEKHARSQLLLCEIIALLPRFPVHDQRTRA